MPDRADSTAGSRPDLPTASKAIVKDVDFGKTAADYARHRAGFPDSFFERLTAMGVIRPGLRALDLGTGTGTIARGIALRGCDVVGLDRSEALMAEAARLDRDAGLVVRYVQAAAEETGMPAASFDLVAAGQCWHWFDGRRAAAEARRVLRPGGRLVIANFDWIPLEGNMADATEKLIEKHNPKWKLGGGLGIHPLWPRDMAMAGFRNIETFSFDVDAQYTHEAWRGRIRASAGVGASLAPAAVARFDDELKRMLAERYPQDPMAVLHRVFAAIGVAP
ncbi:MAG TPA: class I SAM-dependent methyltransferase [Candidatus Binataceae bacterium]|nr:class I SAM-dependent methyltransferase [Candidatus Binataceae bacterium]